VFDHFHIGGGLRDEGLDAGTKRIALQPHNAFGVDPAEIRIEPLVGSGVVSTGESGEGGAIGHEHGIVTGLLRRRCRARQASPRPQRQWLENSWSCDS